MATYAIGDVQGCYQQLKELLKIIQFDPSQDKLWFTGDLVNRGENSLAVIRYVKSLGENAITVLGNHDLHLLAVAAGLFPLKNSDTFTDILAAEDREELITWLRYRPLLHYDITYKAMMVHAGLPPQWNLPTALACANEVTNILRSANYTTMLQEMYGDKPNAWNSDLQGYDRWRFIINALTRMRYCERDGRLNLNAKGNLSQAPSNCLPWYAVPGRQNSDLNIIFGHWAALYQHWNTIAVPKIYPIDGGCVWGNALCALRLEDFHRYSIACS